MVDNFDIDFDEMEKKVKDFIDEVFGNYKEFSKALSADIIYARDLFRKDEKNQFNRRIYIRTLFAFAEGVLYAKRLILNRYIESRGGSLKSILSPHEIVLLSDDGFDEKNNGDIKTLAGENRQPFLNLLRFVVKTYAKYRGKEAKIEFDGHGWEFFQTTYKVRNRIAHPKNKTDLEISDKEMEQALTGAKWFADNIWIL